LRTEADARVRHELRGSATDFPRRYCTVWIPPPGRGPIGWGTTGDGTAPRLVGGGIPPLCCNGCSRLSIGTGSLWLHWAPRQPHLVVLPPPRDWAPLDDSRLA